MIALLLASLLLTLPPSLEPRRVEVEVKVAESIGAFWMQCVKWQKASKCGAATQRARVTLIDAPKFACGNAHPSGYCRGLYYNIRNIKVAYDNPDVDKIIIHELCHGVAGRRSGHNGLEDCQSR